MSIVVKARKCCGAMTLYYIIVTVMVIIPREIWISHPACNYIYIYIYIYIYMRFVCRNFLSCDFSTRQMQGTTQYEMGVTIFDHPRFSRKAI